MQIVIDALMVIPYLYVLGTIIYGMLDIRPKEQEPTTLLGVVSPQEEKTNK